MTTMNAELYDALISANAPDDQARKAAVSVASIVGYPPIDEIATKADLQAMKAEMQEMKAEMATKADVEALRLETKTGIEALRWATEVKIKGAENRLIIWTMGIVGIGIAILKLIL